MSLASNKDRTLIGARGVGAMNQSRFPTLAAAAAALAAQTAAPQQAQAGVVPIIPVLTEIDGLEVNGTLYDVTFVPDSGPPVPQFTSEGDARAASVALGAELVALLKTEAPPSLSIFTAFGDAKNVQAFEVVLGSSSSNSTSTFFEILGPQGFSSSTINSTLTFLTLFPFLPAPFVTDGTGDYAIWTSATVPEPSSWVLMGVGMASVAAAGAVRRKKKRVLTQG